MESAASVAGAVAILFAVTGAVLWATDGHQNDAGLTLFVIAWVSAVWASLKTATTHGISRYAPGFSRLWIAASAFVWCARDPLRYAPMNGAKRGLQAAALAIVLLTMPNGFSTRLGARLFGVCTLIAFIVFALVLPASPAPFIDVFTSSTAAVDHLLAGRDPYSQTYADIYNGRYDYKPGIPYWPAVLLAEAVGRLLVHDIRLTLVLALAGSAFFGYKTLERLGLQEPCRSALTAAWCMFPVAPLVVEMAWLDPLLILAFSCLAWALVSENLVVLSIALGFGCAFKQYGPVGGLVTLAFCWRKFGPAATIRVGVGALATMALTIVPFAVADARGLYTMTIDVPAHQQMRTDAMAILPLLTFLKEPWPGILNGLVGLGTVAMAAAWFHQRAAGRIADWAAALVFVYGAFFLFAKQAFCNYYFFFAFFVWLELAALIAEDPSGPRIPHGVGGAPAKPAGSE